ncbi:hypothetical protein C1646_759430 [Rhizophagus diaphanus]|nr:hypothetical protein C1646_759430 [Rhizophagus diaphanus] [Rhizophagus sp. MUCL 43196]
MCDAAERKSKYMGRQNIEYSEEFTSFLVILGGISSRALDLFKQNLEEKTAMTDNIKLKEKLLYSPILSCIIGSTLLKEETIINVYSDIPSTISKIKEENAIIKDILLPKFPLIIIALIPNKGSDSANDITQLYKKLL